MEVLEEWHVWREWSTTHVLPAYLTTLPCENLDLVLTSARLGILCSKSTKVKQPKEYEKGNSKSIDTYSLRWLLASKEKQRHGESVCVMFGVEYIQYGVF